MNMPPTASNEVQRGRTKTRTPKKRSRWGDAENTSFFSSLSLVPKYVPGALTIEQQEALLVRVRIEELTKKINLNQVQVPDEDEERSPSPVPLYDMKGKRLNTREQRAKEKLQAERHELVQEAFLMNPNFKPPSDYTPTLQRKMRKIPVPVDKYPDYNFIGLIIGPRGNTQKRMEKETGCRIVIRGRGSVKEGKVKKMDQSEDEPLHVLITGESEAGIVRAAKMINDLLVPMDELHNEWKRQQLMELAVINGTLRERVATNEAPSFDYANVKCEICGDSSHPTVDCALRGRDIPLRPLASDQQKQISNEYEKFLEEIGEGSAVTTPQPTANPNMSDSKAYEEFIAAINSTSNSNSQQGWPQAPAPMYFPPSWTPQQSYVGYPPYPTNPWNYPTPTEQQTAPWQQQM